MPADSEQASAEPLPARGRGWQRKKRSYSTRGTSMRSIGTLASEGKRGQAPYVRSTLRAVPANGRAVPFPARCLASFAVNNHVPRGQIDRSRPYQTVAMQHDNVRNASRQGARKKRRIDNPCYSKRDGRPAAARIPGAVMIRVGTDETLDCNPKRKQGNALRPSLTLRVTGPRSRIGLLLLLLIPNPRLTPLRRHNSQFHCGAVALALPAYARVDFFRPFVGRRDDGTLEGDAVPLRGCFPDRVLKKHATS